MDANFEIRNALSLASIAVAHALIHRDGEELVRQRDALVALQPRCLRLPHFECESIRDSIGFILGLILNGEEYLREIEQQSNYDEPDYDEPNYPEDDPWEPVQWDREDFHSDV